MENVVLKQKLDAMTASVNESLGADSEAANMMNSMAALLALPDDKFEVLSPNVIQNYQRLINNPGDKLALVQALNATGTKAEDLTASLNQINKTIDQSNLSRIKRDFLKELIGAFVIAVSETEGIAKRIIPVSIEKCHDKAKLPTYAHQSDSGMDVYALEEIVVHPGETVLVPTGLKVALPAGFELQVRPKSGRALKTKLRVANTPGTIDQGYRDEIKVIIENVDPPIKDITVDDDGKVTSILYGSDYVIGAGEKFAQLVLAEVPKVVWTEVANVGEIGEDRGGGFGSSGLV